MTLTIRTITLADAEGMPTLTAPCTTGGWNGMHVPIVTPKQIRDYFNACADADPDGTWHSSTWDVIRDGWTLRHHNCATAACDPEDGTHDREGDTLWPIDAHGRVELDSLVWQDAA